MSELTGFPRTCERGRSTGVIEQGMHSCSSPDVGNTDHRLGEIRLDINAVRSVKHRLQHHNTVQLSLQLSSNSNKNPPGKHPESYPG